MNRDWNTRRLWPVLALLLLAFVWTAPGRDVQSAEERRSIIVELDGLPPGVVAGHAARRSGATFDRGAHERAIFGSQDAFLARLRREGIDFSVTETSMHVAGVKRGKPNRFGYLINAVGLEVPSMAIDTIRSMPGV